MPEDIFEVLSGGFQINKEKKSSRDYGFRVGIQLEVVSALMVKNSEVMIEAEETVETARYERGPVKANLGRTDEYILTG